jgi:uncharacterized protein YlxP (DUF503 family)
MRIPDSGSLKDKRQVVRSVGHRIRNKFQVSVAEVADNDAWQIATLGVACVSNEARQCERILDEIVRFVRDSRLDAEVFDIETEVMSFS